MKKSILLIGLALFAVFPVSAELTVDDISSPEYLINHGHSIVGAEATARAKAQANGVPYESFQDSYWDTNAFTRFINRVYTYFDPAGDQDTFMNHDIKVTPSYTDL